MTDNYVFETTTVQIGDSVSLPNDSEIVDHYRAGGQHVVAYLAPHNYECGVNGCSRAVDDPSDNCWQHGDDDGE